MSGHVTSNTSLDESRDYGSDIDDEIIVDDGGDDGGDDLMGEIDTYQPPGNLIPGRSPSPAASLVTSSSRDHLHDGYSCHQGELRHHDGDTEMGPGGTEGRADNLSHNGELNIYIKGGGGKKSWN